MVFQIVDGVVKHGVVARGGLVLVPDLKVPVVGKVGDGRENGFCDFPRGEFRPLTRSAALFLAKQEAFSIGA